MPTQDRKLLIDLFQESFMCDSGIDQNMSHLQQCKCVYCCFFNSALQLPVFEIVKLLFIVGSI